jgi:hypothetical protein
MNALKDDRYYQPTQPPAQPPLRQVRSHPRPHQHPHRAVALESCAKLGINGLLAVIAIAALVKLVPYNQQQELSLKNLQTKVADVQGRVDQLQADYNFNSDPEQKSNAMQQQSMKVVPGQRQIVLVEPGEDVPDNDVLNSDVLDNEGLDSDVLNHQDVSSPPDEIVAEDPQGY